MEVKLQRKKTAFREQIQFKDRLNKVYGMLQIWIRNFMRVPEKLFTLLYKTQYKDFHIEYCDTVWSRCKKGHWHNEKSHKKETGLISVKNSTLANTALQVGSPNTRIQNIIQ